MAPRTLATALLVAVTAVWGSTFFLIHDLVRSVPAEDFLAVRFTLAALVMMLVFRRQVGALTRREWVVGLGLGVVYGIAQLLQTIGLGHTPASRAGFLTGLYVVLTPVLGALLLRERVPGSTWVAVGVSLLGVAVLSLTDVRHLALGAGDWLAVVAAAIYALHIVLLGRSTSPGSATGLASVQILAVAVVTSVAALPGGLTTPSGTGGWVSLVYMAVISGAVAMWAQTWAQTHLSASRTAIVMTLEPVFAAGFAVAFGGESMTPRMLLGGALVLAAMYLVELTGPAQAPPVEALHHEGA